KMLYDQAQLTVAYTDTYQLTHDTTFGDATRTTIDYVLRVLRDPAGGFYAAQDADSATVAGDGHLKEGAFYLWTPEELKRAAGDEWPLAAFYFGEEGGDASRTLAVRHSAPDVAA